MTIQVSSLSKNHQLAWARLIPGMNPELDELKVQSSGYSATLAVGWCLGCSDRHSSSSLPLSPA
jgi:hypothetical protein